MKNVIHIYGASGSGTSTLGRKISEELGYKFMDTDDYFWLSTNPQYTTKRSKEERLALMKKDISEADNVVISGSLVDWGDELIPLFTLVIRLVTDTEIRIERIKIREKQKFGYRIMPEGDMYTQHMEFIEWARKYDTGSIDRSKVKHDEWQKLLLCKQIVLDGADDLEENFKKVQVKINSVIGRQVTVTVDRPLGSYHPEQIEKVTMTNMCMVFDGNKVLVQDKKDDDYSGITFPGGHVKKGEAFTDTVIREVFEETGLKISSPQLCGIKDWMEEDGTRYMVLFYKSDKFEGTITSSEEGEIYWTTLEEMKQRELANGMDKMLEVFLDENVSEYFFYKEDDKWVEELK